MKIAYFLRDDGACGYYRVDLPFKTINRETPYDVLKIEKGDGADKIEKALSAEIITVPRLNEVPFIEALSRFQESGKKVVVDHDDDMFSISPFSPHYAELGTEDVKIEVKGETLDLWKDGYNYNKAANQSRVDGFKRGVEVADLVTVTTEELAEAYREYNDNVKVLPNCVDMNLWRKLPLKRDNKEEIRLFWAGGSSHYQDWLLLKDVIPAIMEKYPQVKLVLMGARFKGTLKSVPEDRIEYHTWVPTPAYPYKTAILDPDIAIIPLEDTEFNRRKSPIKWVEQASLSVPAVTSLVAPYQGVYSGTNGVFVENNSPEGWYAGISTLINNSILRAKIGGEAYRTVETHYDIRKRYADWVNTYSELINGD